MDPFLYFFCEKRKRDVSQSQDIESYLIILSDDEITDSEDLQLQSRHDYTKTARLVKCLPYKHKDLSSMPQKPCGNSQPQADAGKPNTKEADPRGAGGRQPTLTANGKKKKGGQLLRNEAIFRPPHTHTPAHNTIPLTII